MFDSEGYKGFKVLGLRVSGGLSLIDQYIHDLD